MSRVCQVTGRGRMSGNRVSHANNKTRRRFQVNLHERRFWSEQHNRFIKLRVSRKGLRLVDKIGVDAVVEMIRARKKSEEA
jgi:large subunit ribosomal protein L28